MYIMFSFMYSFSANGEAKGVRLKSGAKVYSNIVITNADPFRYHIMILYSSIE